MTEEASGFIAFSLNLCVRHGVHVKDTGQARVTS